MSSQNRFGYEWDKYSEITPMYEEQFLNWTSVVPKEFWKDKHFLDAGCGMGRNSYWPLHWGAASGTAFDYDDRSVASARKTLESFSNATVMFISIYGIDWQDQFDVAFSIGVIHHLKSPHMALKKMVEALKPGGRLIVWVYSYEGNEWIVRYVNPIRIHITSRLPVSLVHLLSYFCSIPLYLFVKLFKGPTSYLKQLSTFDFWHIHSIVFDQLIPDIANYWKKEEVHSLVEGLPLRDIEVTAPPNGLGWILSALKQ